MGKTIRRNPKRKANKTRDPPSQRDRPPETNEPETDQVSGSDTDPQWDSTKASPVATSPAGSLGNSPGLSTKATPFVKKPSQARKEQAEKATLTARGEEMASEYGSTASETSERSKTSGRKSPDARHARRMRTKEAEPLTEATLVVCLKQLVSEIGREFKNALAHEKDRDRTSEPPVQDDVARELVDLKKEMIESRIALTKDIGAMSRAFSNEVTIAITTTRQHAETMNQGSLQAIFDQLANRTPFINGNTQVPSSSSSDPIPGNGPMQGTFLFEQDPRIPAQEKGKGRADDPGSPKSEPKPSINSPAPSGLSPIAGPSRALPQSPNPSELKKDQPYWHTPSPGRTPTPSPRRGRAPSITPQGCLYENGGPGGDPGGGGDDDDDGGRGGRGGPPPPGDPPGDPDGGSTGDPPVEPSEGSRERNPRTGGTSRTTAPSGAPERATATPGGYHGYDWRQLDPARRTSIAPHGRTPGEPAGLSRFDAFR